MHVSSLTFVLVYKALFKAKLARAGEIDPMPPPVSSYQNGTSQKLSKPVRNLGPLRKLEDDKSCTQTHAQHLYAACFLILPSQGELG